MACGQQPALGLLLQQQRAVIQLQQSQGRRLLRKVPLEHGAQPLRQGVKLIRIEQTAWVLQLSHQAGATAGTTYEILLNSPGCGLNPLLPAQPALHQQISVVRLQGSHHPLQPAQGRWQLKPPPQRIRGCRDQCHPMVQLGNVPPQLLIPELMLLLQLRHIQSSLQHPPPGGQQHQVIVNQGRRQRLRVPSHQGTTATDQSHAAVAADLQIGARQAAGLPEALQKAAGPIAVRARQRQHPTRRITGIQQGEAEVRPNPAGEFGVEVEPRQREGTITPLTHPVPGRPPLPRRRHSLGIGRKTRTVGQPMHGQGGITGNKTGRSRQLQRLIHQVQRTAPFQPPEQAGGHQHQGEQGSGQGRQKGAGLHGPAVSDDVIFVHHRRMAPWKRSPHDRFRPGICSPGCRTTAPIPCWWTFGRTLNSIWPASLRTCCIGL